MADLFRRPWRFPHAAEVASMRLLISLSLAAAEAYNYHSRDAILSSRFADDVSLASATISSEAASMMRERSPPALAVVDAFDCLLPGAIAEGDLCRRLVCRRRRDAPFAATPHKRLPEIGRRRPGAEYECGMRKHHDEAGLRAMRAAHCSLAPRRRG